MDKYLIRNKKETPWKVSLYSCIIYDLFDHNKFLGLYVINSFELIEIHTRGAFLGK